MIPEGFNPGDTCPVCGHKFYKEQGPDYCIEGCSDFCARTSPKEKEDFLNLKDEEYGLYPCAQCGCMMEGEYTKDAICSECYRKNRFMEREKLLYKALDALDPTDPLVKEITNELAKKVSL